MSVDSYTVSLLHMNGPNGSTTFLDDTDKTWTANGNAQISTSQSVFGGASGLFDGTGDYISTPDVNDWQLDGGSNSNKWTVDFWIRFNGDPGTTTPGFIQQRVDNNNYWTINLNSNQLRFFIRSGGSNLLTIQNAWDPATATWYHVAVVKDGTNGYLMFINGSQIGTTQTNTTTLPDYAGSLQIGRFVDAAGAEQALNGWLDEFRISKGIARWTSNFTPPTKQYGMRPVATMF